MLHFPEIESEHAEILQFSSDHHFCRDLGKRKTGRFSDERNRARCARVHLKHIHLIVLHGILNVDQTADVERVGKFLRDLNDLEKFFFLKHERREHARTVAGVDPCFFNVFHHSADQYVVAVTDCIHVEFKCIL